MKKTATIKIIVTEPSPGLFMARADVAEGMDPVGWSSQADTVRGALLLLVDALVPPRIDPWLG